MTAMTATRGAYLMNRGHTGYHEAWGLQRSLAAAVSQGAIPDTVLLLEHPPTVTLGRRTEPGEVHIPDGSRGRARQTDKGGRFMDHGPGQLVCYPILDLSRHEKDVKLYCRNLEEAIIGHRRGLRPRGDTHRRAHRRLAALAAPQNRLDRDPHHPLGDDLGYALNVDLDPAPFTDWITACGLEDAAFTSLDRELGSPSRSTRSGPLQPTRSREVFGLRARRAPRPRAGPLAPAASRPARRLSHPEPLRLDSSPWRAPSLSPTAAPPRVDEGARAERDTRYYDVKELIHGASLHTICEEARCPNIAECWGRGTATFQILGDTCTRACRYCYVHSGRRPSRSTRSSRSGSRRPRRRWA